VLWTIARSHGEADELVPETHPEGTGRDCARPAHQLQRRPQGRQPVRVDEHDHGPCWYARALQGVEDSTGRSLTALTLGAPPCLARCAAPSRLALRRWGLLPRHPVPARLPVQAAQGACRRTAPRLVWALPPPLNNTAPRAPATPRAARVLACVSALRVGTACTKRCKVGPAPQRGAEPASERAFV
jgi:hypothetical protein